jgi:colanic acid biosynthesis glycosyl transferase WcaI
MTLSMNKIIFINRYYKPDHSATAQILTDLAEYLITEGKHVWIVTSRLSYDIPEIRFPDQEAMAGVKVIRVWTSSFGRSHLVGRAIDYLTFYLSAFFCLLRIVKRNDTVVAKTDPPLISVVAAVACKLKGASLINWIQDLFPEVAAALKVRFATGPFGKVLKALRNWSLRQAKLNVVIGELMKERLLKEGIKVERITVIHNWVVGPEMRPIPRDENSLRKAWGLDGKFVVGYSGNLGRAHNYETMLAAVEALKDNEDIRFLFIGGGAGMDLLKQGVVEKQLNNVLFKPYQPLEKLSESLSAPDVHLITLQPELEGLIVPSKFYGVLAVERPIIFIGDENGEIGRTVINANIGRSTEAGNALKLTEAIVSISKSVWDSFEKSINHHDSKKDWCHLLTAERNVKRKVLIVYHYVAHYRVPLFQELSKSNELVYTIISGEKPDISIKLADPKLSEKLVADGGIRWLFLENIWIFNKFLWQKGLYKNIRENNYCAVIYMGNVYFLSTWILLLYDKLRGKKTFMWGHGILHLETGMKGFVRRLFYKLVDVHFVYSNRSIELLKQSGLTNTTYIEIYNSLDYDSHLQLRAELDSREGYRVLKPFRIIFVGRLTPQKNINLLINSLEQLIYKLNLDVICTIVGDGEEKYNLIDLVKAKNLDDFVEFKGAIYDDSILSSLIYDSDICVSPGEVGLTAIHAMSFGTPVITHGYFDKQMPEFEAIKQGVTGDFFEYNNVNSLTEKINQWLTGNYNRELVRKRCYEVIDSHYTPKMQADIFTKEILKVLEGEV